MKLPKLMRLGLLACLFITWACAPTRHSDRYNPSGFLQDYDRLSSFDSGYADRWSAPGFNLNNYSELYLPNVEIWLTSRNRGRLSEETVGQLAMLYHELATEKLRAAGWVVVNQPGPHTATIRLALTELVDPNRIGNFLTSIPYMSTGAIRVTAVVADIHVFVGKASSELQIVDSSTGKIMAEAIDRQVGQHTLLNIGSNWSDVKDALDIWTTRLADGLQRGEDAG